MGFETRFSAVRERVDARLHELLPSEHTRPEKLHSAMRYACLSPGKRLRPALCLFSAAAADTPGEAALDAGCALEMVHAFSLIHDDLPAIDNDDLRRGRPTCHKAYGEALAILAGDALFALAFQTLARVQSEPARVVRCLERLSASAGSDGLVGGEVVDVLSEGKKPSEDLVHYIHSRKTGSLIASSCAIGAEIGGGSTEVVELLHQYGQQVGLAFQIADDVLNEVSTPEQLGKAAGSDRAHGKATFPALYGLEGARHAARDAVNNAIALLPLDLPGRTDLVAMAHYSIERLN